MRPGALTVRQSKGFLIKSLWDSQPDPEGGVGATGPLTPATPPPAGTQGTGTHRPMRGHRGWAAVPWGWSVWRR